MAIKIDGTAKRKSGGGGLGSLLGKVLGGAAGFLIGGPAGAMTGAGIGGGVGGAIGGAASPGSQKELGVPVQGAVDSGMAPPKPKTSAIDRLNSALDLGTSLYGGVNALNGLTSAVPKQAGTLMTQNTHSPDKFMRNMTRVA